MSYELTEKLAKLKPYDPIQGEYNIRLDANESFFNINETISGEIAKTISKISLNRYPDPMALGVVKAFAKFYNINEENVTASNGSDELISIITSCFLKKGDNLLTVVPDFSMYAFYGSLYEVNVHKLNKDVNLEISVDEIIEYCNENKINAVIFSNPCNPTSRGIKKQYIIKLLKSVKSLVILDEAYMDFWTESVIDKATEFDNLIILKTCSKAIGLAGVRLGFAVSSVKITNALRAAKSPYNTDSISQALGECVLSHQDLLKENLTQIICNTKELYAELCKLFTPYDFIERIYETCTNFVFVKTIKADEIYKGLLSESIAIRNFGEYIRISTGSKAENLQLIKSLDKVLVNIKEGQNEGC